MSGCRRLQKLKHRQSLNRRLARADRWERRSRAEAIDARDREREEAQERTDGMRNFRRALRS